MHENKGNSMTQERIRTARHELDAEMVKAHEHPTVIDQRIQDLMRACQHPETVDVVEEYDHPYSRYNVRKCVDCGYGLSCMDAK